MRRALVLLALLALAAAPAALAKRTSFRVVGGQPRAGTPWHAQIVVTLDGRPYRGRYRPALGLLDATGAVTQLFPSRATKRPGVFAVAVVFPHPGRWRYWIGDLIEGGDWYFSVRVTA